MSIVVHVMAWCHQCRWLFVLMKTIIKKQCLQYVGNLFRTPMFLFHLMNWIPSTFNKIYFRYTCIPLDLLDDKSPLVQVMAWCCQATSHYLNQCWPRYCNGVTRPQWANSWKYIPSTPVCSCTRSASSRLLISPLAITGMLTLSLITRMAS